VDLETVIHDDELIRDLDGHERVTSRIVATGSQA
jgi:hypothetical protein